MRVQKRRERQKTYIKKRGKDSMGSGISTEDFPKSVEEALTKGFSQDQIDEYQKLHSPIPSRKIQTKSLTEGKYKIEGKWDPKCEEAAIEEEKTFPEGFDKLVMTNDDVEGYRQVS